MSWNTKFLRKKFSLGKAEGLHLDYFYPVWVLWFGCTDKSPLVSAQHPTGAASPSPPCPELSPADPRAQPAPASSTQHCLFYLVAFPKVYKKSTPDKCKMQKASGKGCIPSWKRRSCLGVRSLYGERIAAPPEQQGGWDEGRNLNLNL